MIRGGVAFVSGLLFAVGLALAGMTEPAKVVGFLDVAGRWDPSLALVMVGAIGVHLVAWRLVRRRSAPLFAPRFSPLTRTRIDGPLVVGSVLFGVGWGLSGVCPGPALVTAATGMRLALVVLPAMAAGVYLHRLYEAARLSKITEVVADERGEVLAAR